MFHFNARIVLAVFLSLFWGVGAARAQSDITVHRLSAPAQMAISSGYETLLVEYDVELVTDLPPLEMRVTIRHENAADMAFTGAQPEQSAQISVRDSRVRRHQGSERIRANEWTPAGRYILGVSYKARDGAWHFVEPQERQTVLLTSPGRDVQRPLVEHVSLRQDRLTLSADAPPVVEIEYEVRDRGESGLRMLAIKVLDSQSQPLWGDFQIVPLNGEDRVSGVWRKAAPAGAQDGAYRIEVIAVDRAGNNDHNYDLPTLWLQEPGVPGPDSLIIHRLQARQSRIDLGSPNPQLVFDYDVEDRSGLGLDYLTIRIPGASTLSQIFVGYSEDLDGALRATGTGVVELPPLAEPGEHPVEVSLSRQGHSYPLQRTTGTVQLYRGPNGPWLNAPRLLGMRSQGASTDVADSLGLAGYEFTIESPSGAPLRRFDIEVWRDGEKLPFDQGFNVRDGLYGGHQSPPVYTGTQSIALPQGIAQGEYDLKVEIEDENGNVSRYYSRTDVVLDPLVVTNTGEETTPPEIVSLTLLRNPLVLTAGVDQVLVDYVVRDTGSGIDRVEVALHPVGQPSQRLTATTQQSPAPERGRLELASDGYFQANETYVLTATVYDRNGNRADYQSPDTLTTIPEDNLDPAVMDVGYEPRTVAVTSSEQTVALSYHFRDYGPAGLSYFDFRLGRSPEGNQTPYQHRIEFDRTGEARGVLEHTLAQDTRSGTYDLYGLLVDAAGNTQSVYEPGVLIIEGDSAPPVVNALTLDTTAFNLSTDGTIIRVEYDVSDAGGSGLDTISFRLTDRSGNELYPLNPNHHNGIDLDGQNHAQGFEDMQIVGMSVREEGRYQLAISLKDRAGNVAYEFSDVAPVSPEWITILSSHRALFGPFSWAGAGTAQMPFRDIYRLSGLHHGPPTMIHVDIDHNQRDWPDQGFNCSLPINPARYNGSEYIILADDFSVCGGLSLGQVRFLITADERDVGAGLDLRRFKVGPSGRLTDLTFDTAPRMVGFDQRQETTLELGPYEWVETSPERSSYFLFTAAEGARELRVAFDNAAIPGFSGTFDDCTITLPSRGVEWQSHVLTPDELRQCGDFRRADIRFQLVGEAGWIREETQVHRLIRTANMGVSDFAPDTLQPTSPQITPLDGGRSRADFPTFEWTGDANAPTRNMFRLVGLTGGMPLQIQVAISNPTRGAYANQVSDCELVIQPDAAGAYDYLIEPDDLAVCGDFGRANLSFRIIYETSKLQGGPLRLNRFSMGASGDLTDFSFDLDPSQGQTPLTLGSNVQEVQFGPFEWTGDHTVSTQNVFRISGLGGEPYSIDVALENAAEDGFQGRFEDCSITPRASRAGDNEYIIASRDFADCQSFGRADVRFRIRAHPSQFSERVQMRRFAVTSSGGLTDFSFDNQ